MESGKGGGGRGVVQSGRGVHLLAAAENTFYFEAANNPTRPHAPPIPPPPLQTHTHTNGQTITHTFTQLFPFLLVLTLPLFFFLSCSVPPAHVSREPKVTASDLQQVRTKRGRARERESRALGGRWQLRSADARYFRAFLPD